VPQVYVFHWSPGIGDPTVGGWVTVALYFLAMISCWRTSTALVRTPLSTEYRTWQAIAVMFLALGINKQLDLQSALTEIGRIIAINGGWYGQRQGVQYLFILGVAVACAAVSLGLIVLARRSPVATWGALVGTTLVLGFVLIRAASFHHVDKLIGQKILGLRWNWVLEMGGITIVLLSSEWRRRMKAAALRLSQP
jgi:NADH:ubiquinone oxidoreductase subunit K